MPPAVKEKSKKTTALAAKASTHRKTKFQADLAPSEDSMIRVLEAELRKPGHNSARTIKGHRLTFPPYRPAADSCAGNPLPEGRRQQ